VFLHQRVQTTNLAVVDPRQAEFFRRLADKDVGGMLGRDNFQGILDLPGAPLISAIRAAALLEGSMAGYSGLLEKRLPKRLMTSSCRLGVC